MKCPIDSADLVMSERQGVEIDYCPTCRGIWLDRGELDKILDRASASLPASAPAPAAPPVDAGRQHYPPEPYADVYKEPYRGGPYREDDRTGRPHKKRKESWLGDILDFG